MVKYVLSGYRKLEKVEVESECLPRVGEEYSYDAQLYHVVKIRHETFRRGLKMDGKLETEIRVF